MRALLQRVTEATVRVDGQVVGQIGPGLGWLVLLGVGAADDAAVAASLARKTTQLRCFEDAAGKTNLSVADVRGSFLVVSQFTLYADVRRGRRPGFSYAAPPQQARELVEVFVAALRSEGFRVETGVFGASMQVVLVNDGPFTIWLDSADLVLASSA